MRFIEVPSFSRKKVIIPHTNQVNGSFLSFLRCDFLFGLESHNFLEVTSGEGRGKMRDFVHTNSFLL